ncbi:MAG: hypothetical protein RDV00_01200 [Clostridia bacterium]|nr:hypothetical protein [Clostridia bacterium]MDQ7790729.1 hypothetical protein [Clostridia bacterium]
MTEAFDQTARMGLKPMNTILGEDLKLTAHSEQVFEPMHVPVLNIGVRVISTAEVLVIIEESDGFEWTIRDKMETVPGETVWHHNLRNPDFRVRVRNQSPTEEVMVSVGIKWMARVE